MVSKRSEKNTGKSMVSGTSSSSVAHFAMLLVLRCLEFLRGLLSCSAYIKQQVSIKYVRSVNAFIMAN